MTRVKGGPQNRRRHKKVFALTKGYRMSKRKLFKVASEALKHADEYAFAGRRMKKRQFRKQWIISLNAAVRLHDMTYSTFIKKMKDAKVELDRKVLSNLAVQQPEIFEKIVKSVK